MPTWMPTWIPIVLLALAALAAGSIVVESLRLGITPTPGSRRARRAILDLLPGDLAGVVVEAGCGWGGLAIALARRVPSARVVAYERSPVPWLVSRLRVRLARVPNLEVRRRDFFRESFAGVDAVVAYLYTGAMTRLGPKLAAELRPGTPVVSHVFRIPGWTPEREVVLPDVWRGRVILYRSPGR